MKRTPLTATCLTACLLLAGCDFLSSTPQPVTTLASMEMIQTAVVLTQNAPPPGFAEVAFSPIDSNLAKHPAWHATIQLSFDGYLADTSEKAQGSISAEVYSNELTGNRRVLLKASGAAFGLDTDRDVEGVRIGTDYYLVDANKVCTKVGNPAASKQVADLAAAPLIGGVKKAETGGHRKKDGSTDIFEYTFSPDSVLIPSIVQQGSNGSMQVAAGDLWVAPSLNAVWQYTVTFDATNVIVQGTHPLTGKIKADYRMLEADVQYNITIPFGC